VTGRLRAGASALAKLAELLLFPSFCRLCREPLDRPGERVVCGDCLARISPRPGAECSRCGRFLDTRAAEPKCARCLRKEPPYSIHRSCGAYGGTLKDVILLFKYRRYAPLSRPLAGFAADCLGPDDRLWRNADGLVPVPLHPARHRERGFNQSRLLARELGRLRGIAVLDGCLVKTRNAPAQAGLKAAEREKNVRKVYAARRPDRVRGRTLVLVDDVTTTGATLRECARVLIEAGAKEVRAITLAQAP
jgi:competence protein ComFC